MIIFIPLNLVIGELSILYEYSNNGKHRMMPEPSI
jgi:hypothetical protein